MVGKNRLSTRVLCWGLVLSHGLLAAADWPQYRRDAGRSGSTEETPPANLALHWSHARLPLVRAWPSSRRLDFDRLQHLVVASGRVYLAGNTDHGVHALDARTGRESWSAWTGAPVRVAPAWFEGRVFATSDDGCLWVLDAETGATLRRQRGGPEARCVLGNGHLVSAWPARGGPALSDGIVYWAAGIWPTDGIFVRADDAASGENIWINDSAGFLDLPQPHGGADARSGIAVQGHLAVNDGQIILPTGRSVPAVLDRKTGAFSYFHLQKYGHSGGTDVTVWGAYHINRDVVFESRTGHRVGRLKGRVAVSPEGLLEAEGPTLRAWRMRDVETFDRKGKDTSKVELEKLWETRLPFAITALVRAGDAVLVGGEKRLARVQRASREVAWSSPELEGTVQDIAVADGRVFASTDAGFIYCFGARRGSSAVAHVSRDRRLAELEPDDASDDANEAAAPRTRDLVARSGVREGFCVDLRSQGAELARGLALATNLRIDVVIPDEAAASRAREQVIVAGLQGRRIAVHARATDATGFPKHFADLVIVEADTGSAGQRTAGQKTTETPLLTEARRLARPWGGVIAHVSRDSVRVEVRGGLEGAGQWTHLYADASNSCSSRDSLVRGPLRTLWFRDADLPMPQRHGRAPAPLFLDGVLVVEGLDRARGVQAYNGRVLWERSMPGILKAYDQDHLMGSAGTGSNICLARNPTSGASVYVHRGTSCLALDLESGERRTEFPCPPETDGDPGTWGFLAATDELLFGTVADTEHIVKWRYLKGDMSRQFTESESLFALEPSTGSLRWRYDAEHSIRHNAVSIGDTPNGGRVFLIDRETARVDRLAYRRGETETKDPEHLPGKLLALDARTGEVEWTSDEEVWGTMLAFDAESEVLLMAYQPTRFRLPSEVGGRLAAYHSRNGYRLWTRKADYSSRPLIRQGAVYAQGGSWDVQSGTPRPFPFQRSYGCGILAGSEHLFLFRSATLGYIDIDQPETVRNFGGLRPGCWINALPVGGIVLVPDGSAGCACSYQNRASMALETAE